MMLERVKKNVMIIASASVFVAIKKVKNAGLQIENIAAKVIRMLLFTTW